MPCSKFKFWQNRIVISLQYHKLHRKYIECAQEWAADSQYKEYDRLLTGQLLNGQNDDDGIIDKILRGCHTGGY